MEALGWLPAIWQCGLMNPRTSFQAVTSAFVRALRFYTRLPVPSRSGAPSEAEDFGFAAMAAAVPLAGALIGALAGLALLVSIGMGHGGTIAAIFAVACGVVVTGALHEDGLADMADGIFVQASIQRRLEIMRDSRLGTFGVLALIVVMALRIRPITG